jgi:hypothetical protein
VVNRILAITGVILGAGAIFVASLYPTHTLEIAVMAIAGSGLLIWFFIVHFEAFKTFSRRRATYLKLNTLILIGMFIFIIILMNLIVRQYYFRYDLSVSRKFSLAPQSVTAAKLIDGDTRIIFFGVENSPEFASVYNLLESYRYLNKKITYEMYDLDRVPLLAKKYGVREYNTFVAVKDDKSVSDNGTGEETVTNLLIRVNRKKSIRVRFLQGHNEHPLRSEERIGYSQIAGKLESLGYSVDELNLLQEGRIPDDSDILVIASPASELSEDEYSMLQDYRLRGGKLILLINSPGQLSPFLSMFHLETSRYPIYDSSNIAGADPSTPLVKQYYPSPVTRDFNLSTVFPGVYEVKYTGMAGKGFDYTPFIRSSRQSWFEKNGDGIMQPGEEEGYQIIAGIMSVKNELMKIIVFGDSDFISNAYVGVAGNANLFLNAVNWLAGEGALTRVAPMEKNFIPMFITDRQSAAIRLIPIGISLVIVIGGTIVWYRRRSL